MATPNEQASPPKQPPDLRILQANERTFLAWVRTGLGLVVLGFGLTRVNAWLESVKTGNPTWIHLLGIAFAAIGLLVIPLAAWRHVRIYRSLCRDEPVLPKPYLVIALASLLVILGAVMLVMTIIEPG